jgi:hypothetical protein
MILRTRSRKVTADQAHTSAIADRKSGRQKPRFLTAVKKHGLRRNIFRPIQSGTHDDRVGDLVVQTLPGVLINQQGVDELVE